MEELQLEFEEVCLSAIGVCRSLGYIPTTWIRMIQDHGAVEAARRLVISGDFQDGFLRLIKLGRADLSIENILLGEQWNELFDEQVRGVAKWRLETARSN